MATIFIAVVILSILILIHELGHYTLARIVGVKVEEFGIGLPPRIKGIRYKGTIYSINWLPIGGFVRLAGEDDSHEVAHPTEKHKHMFWAQSRINRILIITAGVIMNFTLAVGLTSFLIATKGIPEESKEVYIQEVSENSPAADAGLLSGDLVRSVTTRPGTKEEETVQITSTDQLIFLTKDHLGENIILSITREGTDSDASLVPRPEPPEGEGALGISITQKITRTVLPVPEAVFTAASINIRQAGQMLSFLGKTFLRAITLKPPEQGIAGPVGIIKVTGEAAKYGFDALIEFMALLSLNLAVLNILPIPALDGGRLLFILLESVFGKRIKPSFEQTAHQYGMLFLILLIILITANDIFRIVSGSL